jgi:hypothetical protein
LNPRPLGYEQAERRPSASSLSLGIACELGRSRGAVSPVSPCAVPSRAVLITAMVTRPAAPQGKGGLAWPMPVHQSRRTPRSRAGAARVAVMRALVSPARSCVTAIHYGLFCIVLPRAPTARRPSVCGPQARPLMVPCIKPAPEHWFPGTAGGFEAGSAELMRLLAYIEPDGGVRGGGAPGGREAIERNQS